MNIRIVGENHIVVETEFGTITINDSHDMFNATLVYLIPSARDTVGYNEATMERVGPNPTNESHTVQPDARQILVQIGPPAYRNTLLKDFDEAVS